MTNHSPLPWKVIVKSHYAQEGRISEIQDSDGKTIVETDRGCYPPKAVDAELIVKAVNLFPRLVEALEFSLPYVKNNTAAFPRVLSKSIEELLKEARGTK